MGGRSRCRTARAAYAPCRARAAHPAYAADGSLEPGPRAGIYRTTAPDRLPTDPSSPDPIAIDPTATESRLGQARNTPFSTAPARTGLGTATELTQRRLRSDVPQLLAPDLLDPRDWPRRPPARGAACSVAASTSPTRSPRRYTPPAQVVGFSHTRQIGIVNEKSQPLFETGFFASKIRSFVGWLLVSVFVCLGSISNFFLGLLFSRLC